MPYCEFCDLELLPDAHYCGRCGQARAIHRGRGAFSTGHASQFGVPHVHTETGRGETPRPIIERHEEEQRRNVLFPVGHQSPAGTVPSVQGIPQMGGVPTIQGKPPALSGGSAAPNWMSGVSSPAPTNFARGGMPSAPVTPTPSYQPPVSPQPQPPYHEHQHHSHHPHQHRIPSGKLHVERVQHRVSSGKLPDNPVHRRSNTVPKWLLIVIILLLLAIGGGGVLAAVLHLPIPGFAGNANTSSSQIQSTTGNGSTNLQFSGALKTATMTALTYKGCSGGAAFVFQVQGSIDGTPYSLSISISGSTGTRNTASPGTYTSNAFVNLHQRSKPIAAPWMWEAGLGVGQESITVNADGASGTVLAAMPSYKGGSAGTVTVSGNWTCNSITVPGGNGGGGYGGNGGGGGG